MVVVPSGDSCPVQHSRPGLILDAQNLPGEQLLLLSCDLHQGSELANKTHQKPHRAAGSPEMLLFSQS